MHRFSSLLLCSLLACTRDEPTDTPNGPSAVGECESPEQILDARNEWTGFVRCADGSINRVEARAADTTIGGTPCPGEAPDTGFYVNGCDSDSECSGPADAACVTYFDPSGGGSPCDCATSCETDAQCGPGFACIPKAAFDIYQTYGSTCAPAACLTNDDCASGECGLSSNSDDCASVRVEVHTSSLGLACRTDEDTCRADGSGSGGECAVGSDGHFTLIPDECDIGRPLRIDGAARVAPTRCAADWSLPQQIRNGTESERHVAATRWTRTAQLEHASVASFNRVALQLMSLGAPPDLLRDTLAAAADEVHHAQLCFGIASELSGEPVGPGPLSLRDMPLEATPADVLRDLIEEACVRETLGVAEAHAAAEQCMNPSIRDTLRTITRDELRHSQLAWRTLRWMLHAFPELRELASELLHRELSRAEAGEFAEPSAGIPHLGLLSGRERAAVHRHIAQTVLRPVVDSLLRARAA